MVVEIAGRLNDLEFLAQESGDKLPGRGFPCASGNGEQGFSPPLAHVAGQGLKGDLWVFHLKKSSIPPMREINRILREDNG